MDVRKTAVFQITAAVLSAWISCVHARIWEDKQGGDSVQAHGPEKCLVNGTPTEIEVRVSTLKPENAMAETAAALEKNGWKARSAGKAGETLVCGLERAGGRKTVCATQRGEVTTLIETTTGGAVEAKFPHERPAAPELARMKPVYWFARISGNAACVTALFTFRGNAGSVREICLDEMRALGWKCDASAAWSPEGGCIVFFRGSESRLCVFSNNADSMGAATDVLMSSCAALRGAARKEN